MISNTDDGFSLTWWPIDLDCAVTRAEKRAAKLKWSALTVNNISPLEKHVIMRTLASCGDHLYERTDPWVDFHEKIGEHMRYTRAFWFENVEDMFRLTDEMTKLPRRRHEVFLDRSVTECDVQSIMTDSNWLLVKGDEGSILSFDDSRQSVEAMLRWG